MDSETPVASGVSVQSKYPGFLTDERGFLSHLSILVIGAAHTGKTSLVNSFIRSINNEQAVTALSTAADNTTTTSSSISPAVNIIDFEDHHIESVMLPHNIDTGVANDLDREFTLNASVSAKVCILDYVFQIICIQLHF